MPCRVSRYEFSDGRANDQTCDRSRSSGCALTGIERSKLYD
jgi:hypothetical protein